MNTDMVTRESLGHLFGDWSDGIDYERCGHCGQYRSTFDQNKSQCPIGSRMTWKCPPGPSDQNWGDVWAVYPHLTMHDIFGDVECPDVQLFESQVQTRTWLAELVGKTGEARGRVRPYSRIAILGPSA